MRIVLMPPEKLIVTPLCASANWVMDTCVGRNIVPIDRDPQPIKGHFGTYYGAGEFRRYENPFLQDLLQMHEGRHRKTFKYGTAKTWSDWTEQMIFSEVDASLHSECFVHLRVPALRSKVFQKHKIWVDRFLGKKRLVLREIDALEQKIRRRRIRAMNVPRYNDPIEHQIWNYCRQNDAWCRIWATKVGYGPHAKRPAWRVVEDHMAQMDFSKPGALERHDAWLASVSKPFKGQMVPFLNQARAFEPVYEQTAERYGNWVFET